MTGTLTPRQAMQKLADDISDGRWQNLHLLYAENTVVRHPQARNCTALLEGRDRLQAHFEHFFSTGVTLEATPIQFHDTTDPEVVVGQFSYHGRNGFGMDRFDLEACFVWRVRDGLIIESTDYLSQPLLPRI